MGNHRGARRTQRVSRGVIVGVVAVAVLAAAVVGWRTIRDEAADREAAAAASCVEGDATLVVAADPDIADSIRTVAERYAETDPVVRDHCVAVVVNSVVSQQAAAALSAGTWNEAALGALPALWIPQSSADLGTIAREGDPRSVATSPVVLATSPTLAAALDAAAITWADIPRLQADTDSLATVGLPDWGSLRLGRSDPVAGPSLLAIESIAAGVTPVPLTDDSVDSAEVRTALAKLGTQPIPASITDLRGQSDPATAVVHAVATTEHEVLLARNDGVAAYSPGGPTAVADYPAVGLTGAWIDETQHRAADLFIDYLRQPDQSSTLSDNGFRTEADSAALTTTPAIRSRLSELLAVPAVATTVLIDVSTSMGSDDRLTAVTAALRAYVASAPESASLGFWTYSKNLDGTSPFRDQVRTEPLRPDRKRILDESLAAVRPSSASRDQAYPALVAAYTAAVTNYVAGRTNTILLVTDGPDDDSSLTGRGLLDAIAAAADPAKPVRIDVVALGNPPATDTLTQLAERTGGRYTRTAPADVPAAVTTALSS